MAIDWPATDNVLIGIVLSTLKLNPNFLTVVLSSSRSLTSSNSFSLFSFSKIFLNNFSLEMKLNFSEIFLINSAVSFSSLLTIELISEWWSYMKSFRPKTSTFSFSSLWKKPVECTLILEMWSFSISLSTVFEYLVPSNLSYFLRAWVSIIVFTLLVFFSLISRPLLISSVLFLVNLGITFLINSIIESALYLSILSGKLISPSVPSSWKVKIPIGYLEPFGLASNSFIVASSKMWNLVNSISFSSFFILESNTTKAAVLRKSPFSNSFLSVKTTKKLELIENIFSSFCPFAKATFIFISFCSLK